MIKYVVLLRGINVGGRHKVPMVDLKKILEQLGCKNIRTTLATGNVVLESSEKNTEKLSRDIEATLKKKFGFDVPTLVYQKSDVDVLIEKNPFEAITVTDMTRLYVTFLREPYTGKFVTPWYSPDDDFTILLVSHLAVFSVLTLSETTRTTELMGMIEKEFGEGVTTRNWNTILRMVQRG